MNRVVTILKSKTFWSGVIAAAGFLATQPQIGLGEIGIALGMVLAGAGVKDGFIKLSRNIPQ